MACRQGCTKKRESTSAPQLEKEGRDVLLDVCLSRFPGSRRRRFLFERGFQCSSPPVVPVAPVSPVPKLPWSLQPLPSSRFFLILGFQPLGSFTTTLPMRPAQAAVCSERLCPRISAARAPGRADRGSYLAVALGLGAPQAGALQTGAHGPCALTGSRRLGTGAEGKLGPRPDPAIGGGGGGESRREGGGRAGGRAGAGERVSERARPAPPVTHRALCLHPLPCAPFSSEPAAPPTSPAAAFNPCWLGWRRGPTPREEGAGEKGG